MRIDSIRSYRVVVGNREWMHRNCIYIGDDVNDAMQQEEMNGKTAILIAVNGKYSIANRNTYLFRFLICLIQFRISYWNDFNDRQN